LVSNPGATSSTRLGEICSAKDADWVDYPSKTDSDFSYLDVGELCFEIKEALARENLNYKLVDIRVARKECDEPCVPISLE
jgi:hypothetical protein